MTVPRFSMGVGDRFGRQGQAQLEAFVRAARAGVEASPVWNKSNREHLTLSSGPDAVRAEADGAVAALSWKGPYFVDADHIGLATVDRFLAASDFFTIDVADFIGKAAPEEELQDFMRRRAALAGTLAVPGIAEPLELTRRDLEAAARTYLGAAKEAGRVYRRIEAAKGAGNFLPEVSMDETALPQSPGELLLILAMLADEGVPVQTVAPKFSGRFNKGVDYVGDLDRFRIEFSDDLAVAAWAAKEFGLPATLRLSVHSGSDKFSIYPIIREAVRRTGAGLHLKTAGTTWLEELAAVAESGRDGAAVAAELYARALEHRAALSAPYASVLDIDPARLPAAAEAKAWSGVRFARALTHEPGSADYNPDFRQLLHVAYKLALDPGLGYLDALEAALPAAGARVTRNLLDKHLLPLFG